MFLHSHHPNPILVEFGPVRIYWYGLFIVVGIFVAFAVTRWLLEKYGRIKNRPLPLLIKDGNQIVDLSVYLILGGLVGARLAHVLSERQYYISRPLEIFKVWNGGLWIYGAIAGGLVGLFAYVRKYTPPTPLKRGDKSRNASLLESPSEPLFSRAEGKPACAGRGYVIRFLLDIFAPGLVFAQAIGRWGNYFNQELYGLPTKMPWGIPIDAIRRATGFTGSEFFHPVFLYESLWCAFVGIILLLMHKNRGNHTPCLRRQSDSSLEWKEYGRIFLWYLFLYSFGRFIFEFLRIDPVPMVFGIRITQIAAGGVMVAAAGMLIAKMKPSGGVTAH